MDTNTNTNFTDFQTGKFKYTEFKYAEFNDGVHFFCFPREIPFLCNFGPKNQNYQFELKLGTYINLNMQNSVVVFIFSIFDQKYLFFLGRGRISFKFVSLNWNLVPRRWYLLPIGTYSKMDNSLVVFTFSVQDWKSHFWAKLVQNLKIVSLSWNLVLILIQITFFCFQSEIPF